MKRTIAMFLVFVIGSSSMFLFVQDDAFSKHASDDFPILTRSDDIIFDAVLQIPPGGETRVSIDEEGIPRIEGYAGAYYFDHGKLGEAASLIPDWLREPFVYNMLKAASVPIQSNVVIPSFGDIDGDGDDDMALGRDGSLEIYMNVGWEGFPVFERAEYDFWTSENVQRTIEFESGGYLSPYLGYFNGDEYADLLLGTDDGYILLSNPGNGSISRRIGSGRVEGLRISPTMVYKTTYTSEGQLMNNLAFVMGNANGDLVTYEFFISESFNSTGSYPGTDLRISGIMPISSNANPRSWTHRRDLNDPGPFDLAIGSGEGTIQYYRFQNRIGPVLNYQLQENYFSGITSSRMMVPASLDLDGDGSSDLVIGTQNGGIPLYNNLQTPGDPYWRPIITSPVSEATNYRSAFNDRLTIYNESLIEDYLDSIIDPIDPRYRDEIAFACAYTPPGQIRNNGLVPLFQENAKYIYERAPLLDYVSLVEVPGPEGHTTARYNMRAGSEYLTIEIPRDVYYWGVVHPRVTEEEVAYIDPQTGRMADPSAGGRFWREYLWEHADDSYPPGPVYSDDWTGPKAYYPTEFSPPLLKAVVSDPLTLWDMQPYEYPAGFDHAGKINNHPWDFRDHAIEKVSHWVEKTLVLNQQESPDTERPNQPVRIAAGHNGNCGELQDLTIAAARSALIPARGVMLMGEDHVWSEFYAGGWHQWDNYWSDAGGVIANFMNYWWEWGGRGGSGVFALEGDGSVKDVGVMYRSPDVEGKLSVHVKDASNNPVDGARVLVMSHWAMEQVSIDIGPYQSPPPVTAPLPAIWGYTDSLGRLDLNVWRQNFNVVVTSDLGSFVSQKFAIADDEHSELVVTLPGIGPQNEQPPYRFRSSFERAYPVFVEMVEGKQEQTCFLSGASYRQSVSAPSVLCYVEEGEDQGSRVGSASIDNPFIDVMSFYRGSSGATLVMKNTGSITTSAFVRVRIHRMVDEEENRLITYPGEVFVGPDTPDGGPTLYGMAIIPDRAWNEDPENIEIDIIEPSTGYRPPFLYDLQEMQYAMFITWSTFGFDVSRTTTMEMVLDLNITLEDGRIDISLPFTVDVLDQGRPIWLSHTGSGDRPWGSIFSFGARYGEMSDTLSSIGWLDHEIAWAGSFDLSLGRSPEGEVDSSMFPGGRHRLRVTAWDPHIHIITFVCNVNFIASAPDLEIYSPARNLSTMDPSIIISGKVTDDVSVTGLVLEINERIIDLSAEILPDGTFTYSAEIGPVPGTYFLILNATDNVGLFKQVKLNVTLLPPPDTTPPFIEITDPRDGEKVLKGTKITIRGTAQDSGGLASLVARTPSGESDIFGSYQGYSWQFTQDTSGWKAGEALIRIEGEDISGNSAASSIIINVIDREQPFLDREDPVITVTYPVPGTSLDLRSRLEVSGYITDDSENVALYISLNGGGSFFDLTDTMSQNTFYYSIDAMSLIEDVSRIPSMMASYMESYHFILKAVDGSGNEVRRSIGVRLIDSTDPMIMKLESEASSGSGMIRIVLEVSDDTTIQQINWVLEDDSGSQIGQGIVGFNQLMIEGDVIRASWWVPRSISDGLCKLRVSVLDPFMNEEKGVLDIQLSEAEEEEAMNMMIIVAPLMALLLIGAVFLTLIYMTKRS